LLHLYKKVLPEFDDYLTKEGEIILPNLDLFLRGFAAAEDQILQQLENNKIHESKRNPYTRMDLPGRLYNILADDVKDFEKKENEDAEIKQNVTQINQTKGQEVKSDKISSGFQNANTNNQTGVNKMGGALSNMWGPKANSIEIPNKAQNCFIQNEPTKLWGGDHDQQVKPNMLGPNVNAWNPNRTSQGEHIQQQKSLLTDNRNQSNNVAADMMKNELFSSIHGNKTKIMEADPNLASDTSVFMGGWEKNVRIEEMKEKQNNQAKEINNAISQNKREVVMDVEKKFKDELKQISEYQEAKRLFMSKSEFFVEHGGHKEVYFKSKFGIDPEDYDLFLQNIKEFYIEGLIWNYAYYYKGCISWKWCYPYFYAPFAQDLTFMPKIQDFDIGAPFSPVQQLMSVFPPYSSHAIPKHFRRLMLEDDSEISDFYPRDFFVDIRGKGVAWMGEVILPIIDQDRLVKATQKLEHTLTNEEKWRNRLGDTM